MSKLFTVKMSINKDKYKYFPQLSLKNLLLDKTTTCSAISKPFTENDKSFFFIIIKEQAIYAAMIVDNYLPALIYHSLQITAKCIELIPRV